MERLKSAIHKIISEQTHIDWLIVHKVSKLNPETDMVEFSFVDGKERYDEPFKTNQGYISIKTPDSIIEFENITSELTHSFLDNQVRLANLFIVLSRASFNGEDKDPLMKKFKVNLGKETCRILFITLIDSLNSEYYKNNGNTADIPSSTNDWLALFHSTQYMHGFTDPLMSCLNLVRTIRNHKIDFELIENMKPLLRAVLLGWYGFGLHISNKSLKIISEKEEELAFLSACLIDNMLPDKTPPVWLSEKLISTIIEKYWSKIGKQIFVHVFGLSYQNKNQNKLYEKLEDLIHAVLLKKAMSQKPDTHEWINNLEFPADFIALFAWFSFKKVEYNNIPPFNKAALLDQFIRELQRISNTIPVHLASENSSDPFSSFQLYESKYQDALVHILLLTLSATPANKKDLGQVCFEFKPLFYGAFPARTIATHFTELMLLIVLSGYRLNGLGKKEFANLNNILQIITDTILIPYVHLVERDDEIWNPESKREGYQYNAGLYLISNALSNIRKKSIYKHYQDFFISIGEVKIAKWPYEQI